LPEDGAEGGTKVRVPPVGNGRWAEERWTAKRRSRTTQENATSNNQVILSRIKEFEKSYETEKDKFGKACTYVPQPAGHGETVC
jgi:hypothetical protein